MNATANTVLSPDEFLRESEKYKDQFYRYIRRMLWNTAQADDVFAEALLAGFENRAKFQRGTNFRAWMFRIITNKCFVANRQTGRAFASLDEAGREPPAPEEPPGFVDILDHPETFLEECGEEVFAAMQEVSEAQRACLLLRVAEQLSYKEIAEVMDIPVGTVMTHLSRGRGR